MSHSSQNFQRRQRAPSGLGKLREAYFSKYAHGKDVAILIHPQFLRRSGAGQIDCATLKRDYGVIYEIKGIRGVGHPQRKRLYESGILLGEIFNRSFLIKTVLFKTNSASKFDIK